MPPRKKQTESAPVVETEHSPHWGQSTKLVVGLSMVAGAAALLIRFQNLVGPLLMAIILSYLLHPLVRKVADTTRLEWRGAVNLIYLLFLITFFSLLTVSGVALVQQTQALIRVVTTFFDNLPQLVTDLTSNETVYLIPIINYELDVAEVISQLNIDLLALSEQLLNVIRPALGQAGSLLGTVATSAASTLGWLFFIMIVSYFTLADSGGVLNLLKSVELPGHQQDLGRLGRELGRIWNAFLRGQLTLVLLTAIVYYVILAALGVRNALALALVAALAKFLPYIGQWLTSGTIAVVTFFQDGNYFQMEPLAYTIMVTLIILAFDQVVDNLIAPRIFGAALGIHPAGLLVAVLVMASLLGFIGVLLAAPSLASLQLFVRYASRKMVDLDPWPEPEKKLDPIALPYQDKLKAVFQRARSAWRKRFPSGDEQ